jgi:hypothetical protein
MAVPGCRLQEFCVLLCSQTPAPSQGRLIFGLVADSGTGSHKAITGNTTSSRSPYQQAVSQAAQVKDGRRVAVEDVSVNFRADYHPS